MKTTTKLALSNIRTNKSRSFLIMLSILLTTILLTMIGTIGYGTMNTTKINAAQQFGHFYGTFNNISMKQIDKLRLRSEIDHVGLSSFAGTVESQNADLNLIWIDKTTQDLTEFKLKSGKIPEKADEIAASVEFFDALGYPDAKIGDQITLSYRNSMDSPFESTSFTITGFTPSNEASRLKKAYNANVSKEFLTKSTPESDLGYTAYFDLLKSVHVEYDNVKEYLQAIGKDCDIIEQKLSVNSYYLMWELDPGTQTISVCVGISLIIILLSVIVIYNIFQVGIIQKIQEYGKLKALGTTRKQLKQIIFREGMLIALPTIPAGVIFGYLFSLLFSRIVFGPFMTEYFKKASYFCPPILLIVIIFSFLTVWLALKRPMRIVQNVSSIEAIRYQESSKKGLGIRRRKSTLRVHTLTFANLASNKKRTITTICTMGLSCVLFVAMASLAGNIDKQYEIEKSIEHGKFLLDLDYEVNDTAYPENNLDQIQLNNPLTDTLVDQIQSIEGVTKVTSRNILYASINSAENDEENRYTTIAVLNREDFKKYASENCMGDFNYDSLTKANGILYGCSYWLKPEGFSINQQLNMNIISDNSSTPFNTKICGALENAPQTWVITEDTYKSLNLKGDLRGLIWVDCKDKDYSSVEKSLQALVNDCKNTKLDTYQDALKLVNTSSNLMCCIIYGLLGILGLIGFMNLANTLITGIITRKRELGVLQAVGMTNHQLNQMLQLEGLVFTAGTTLVSLIVGCPIGYVLFRYARDHGYYGLNQYHFPVLEIVIMILAIALLQLTLSFILSRNTRKESIIERIHHQG